MAFPLDETITEGQAAHIDDHETIAKVLNALLPYLGMSVDVVETFPRPSAIASVIPATGTTYLTYFTPLVTKTVSNFSMQTPASGSAPSSITLARIGLYTAAANGDVTLVARTASDTSLFDTGLEVETRAFATTGGYPASYELVAGTRYAVGVLQVGTTGGRMIGATSAAGGVYALAPMISAAKSGQTDIDGNLTSVAANTTIATPWCRLS